MVGGGRLCFQRMRNATLPSVACLPFRRVHACVDMHVWSSLAITGWMHKGCSHPAELTMSADAGNAQSWSMLVVYLGRVVLQLC
jgi:hypothetical protein